VTSQSMRVNRSPAELVLHQCCTADDSTSQHTYAHSSVPLPPADALDLAAQSVVVDLLVQQLTRLVNLMLQRLQLMDLHL